MDPLWSETCWSTFKYFIILIVSRNYTLCISWTIKCLIVIDARCKHEDFTPYYRTFRWPENVDLWRQWLRNIQHVVRVSTHSGGTKRVSTHTGGTKRVSTHTGDTKWVSTHIGTAGPTPGFRFLVGTGISFLVPVTRQALGPPDLLT